MTDYETISQLVLWERQARVRRLQEELADCYWEDATVTTGRSSGKFMRKQKYGFGKMPQSDLYF